MAIYGMGITQHVKGVENVRMIVNLLLMRGNIGKPGAGPTPVRGHSNVQGQRTVGITEKTELVPVDKIEKQYGFTAPREKGLDTVESCRGVIDGSVKAFVALGGNFLRAVPETAAMEEAWPRLRLSVQIATKLNRNHLFPGAVTYLLPCLGRIEQDVQASGPQAVPIEDSTSCIHGSTRQGQAGERASAVRARDRRRDRHARCCRPIPSSTGMRGSPTMPRSATRSRRPIPSRSRISTSGCSSPAASGRATRPPSGSG